MVVAIMAMVVVVVVLVVMVVLVMVLSLRHRVSGRRRTAAHAATFTWQAL
jgi:predicted Holliday junction resolvase-like endonuclease